MDALNINSGIAEIFERVARVSQRPAIVGIYGHQNAGKTHLSKLCFNEAHNRGLRASRGNVENARSYLCGGAIRISLSLPNPLDSQRSAPDVCFVEDYIIPFKNDSVEHTGKPMDIIVVIRNYNVCHPGNRVSIEWHIARGDYDLIIDNSDSVRK